LVTSALVAPFVLDLKGSHLDELPETIQKELMSHSAQGNGNVGGGQIKKLIVSKNALKQIDDWLEAMPNLTSLDATQNQIDHLTECIGNLSLTELRLPRNKLSATSVCCIGQSASTLAMNLTCLDLSGNCLEWFPGCLAKLPVLSTLLLSDNLIQSLAVEEDKRESGWLGGFQALETLDVSGNKLTDLGELPTSLIECCPLIRSLSLSNNELASIPPELGVLETLNNLDLRGNPQRSIRTGIIDRSAPEILAYLRSRIDATELETLQSKRAGTSSADKDSKSKVSYAGSMQNVEELKKEMQDIELQLNNVHLRKPKSGP
jgi:Leucine-rich repeat (LRR) protein